MGGHWYLGPQHEEGDEEQQQEDHHHTVAGTWAGVQGLGCGCAGWVGLGWG